MQYHLTIMQFVIKIIASNTAYPKTHQKIKINIWLVTNVSGKVIILIFILSGMWYRWSISKYCAAEMLTNVLLQPIAKPLQWWDGGATFPSKDCWKEKIYIRPRFWITSGLGVPNWITLLCRKAWEVRNFKRCMLLMLPWSPANGVILFN